jgi:hypothetical protein
MLVNVMTKKTKRRAGPEGGAALVIAIFSLMLISVVATALVLSAGTQSAIKANYKSAMQAFYDARAGLEEARGRLWATNPDAITNCVFPTGPPMQVGQVCYIVNPPDGSVDPRDPTNQYADLEYQQEWGSAPPSGAQLIASTSANGGIAGPLYKWVRITPRTEASVNIDLDGDGSIENTPLFFDGMNVNSNSTSQLLTVTALAVTPYGSRRMVQYTVAPAPLASALPAFPAALTLDGNGVAFHGSSSLRINGNDSSAPSGTPSGVAAIGYTNSTDGTSVSAAAVPTSNYTSPTGTASVIFVPPSSPQAPTGIASMLQTPSGLDALVQTITASADAVITGPVTQTNSNNILPSGMSATNPMVTVVNGDLTLSGWHNTGYGLLLVTGQFKYDPDASWDGIILVIGKGVFVANQNGNGQINGAVLVANTRDAAGNLLSNLGPASFSQTGGGNGIQYSSSWVKIAQGLLPYQVLSFREIAQTTP